MVYIGDMEVLKEEGDKIYYYWDRVLSYRNITAFSSHNDLLFASTTAGEVLVTQNRGATWDFNTVVVENNITDLCLYKNNLYAATSKGLYRRDIQ